MRPRLYLNSDVGERPQALLDGSEEKLIALLDWANIACGGHAGDEASMEAVAGLCKHHGVTVGAHPSYPDREHFGREPVAATAEEVAEFVYRQVTALAEAAGKIGAEVEHVKPHGALYNVAAGDREVARAIGEGVARWRRGVRMVGLSGSVALEVWSAQGFVAVPELFADRRYEADGSLRSRRYDNALITDAAEAVRHVEQLTGGLTRDATICVHSDTPSALAIAQAVREWLDSR